MQTVKNDIVARIQTRYLPEGEEDKVSVFIGKYNTDNVRLDLYKTVNNVLKCKLVSSSCFQADINHEIKSRPEKGGWIKVLTKPNTDKLEFELHNMSPDEVEVFRKEHDSING